MSDLINRRALCDDLREYKVHHIPVSSDESEVKGYNDGIDLAISVITEFPSAEPERKNGTWVVHDYALGRERYECTECRGRCDLEYNFCPNCGAKMTRSKDEKA